MVIANLASNKRSQFDISTGQFCLENTHMQNGLHHIFKRFFLMQPKSTTVGIVLSVHCLQ